MEAARSALDALNANCTELSQRRVAHVQSAPQDTLEEWRQAKAVFSEHKVNLIDNETKKRMLQELWDDRVDAPADAEEAQREMQQKKVAVKKLKEANDKRRSELRQQAQVLEAGMTKMNERTAGLAAQMATVAEANAAASELRAKTSAHEASADSARQQLREADASIERARAECDALTKQLQAVHEKAAEESRLSASVASEGDAVAAQLANLQREADAVAGETAERKAWYEHVSAIMTSLSGISRVTADGTNVRYEFEKGTGGLDACALHVRFDASSGALLGAHVAPAGILRIEDLEARAVSCNGLDFLVREVQARLDNMDGACDVPPDALAAGRQTPTSARRRRAAVPALAPPAPTPTGGRLASGTVALPMSSALPFSQQRLEAHPPPQQLAAAVAAHFAVAPSVQGPPSSTPAVAAFPPETPAHVASVVENLDRRMSMAAPKPTPTPAPKPTPNAWSRCAAGEGASPAIASGPVAGVTPHPSGTRAAAPSTRAPLEGATPANLGAPSAPPSARAETVPRAFGTALPDTVPKSEYRPDLSAVAPGLRLTDVDEATLSEIGSARHRDPSRRTSRRSFCRSVAQPRSPCSRAARAGGTMDARSLISEVAAETSAEVYLTVRDVMGGLRSTILTDGTVLDARGELYMYIEADGTVGAPNLEYVGEVTAPGMGGSVGMITKRSSSNEEQDSHIGEVDYGLATIRDPSGSTVVEISRAGEVSGHTGSRCGVIEGFTFETMRVVAAYLMLVDPQMVDGK